ncbi:transcriptional repressor [Micromonospora sp. WMMD1102]|uniref:Fur family transcriptional regulator n=1 Tax=Micromonospora sp. WMMD1102 TaxID=3016105 RepID=UPI002415614C|nr:transcriptional repressor [Micromonospora sp. WMMD1102]MDG4785044.1 transcriptional repressor [Micromonospora sp. WMMD1102]
MATALAALRDSGGRRTAGRQAVLQALANATHLSAAQVRDRIATLGVCVDLSTVHRTLNALVTAGAVHASRSASTRVGHAGGWTVTNAEP